MSIQYLTHITTEGERWDQLAYQYYGDAMRYEPIAQANPQMPLTGSLPGACQLRIPVLDVIPSSEDLPPWFK